MPRKIQRPAFLRAGLLPLAAALLTAGLLLAPTVSRAAEVLWYGQSAYRITTPGGKVILIDPFISGNPLTPAALKNLTEIGPVDLILVTHGHGDHVGDTVEIAKATGAKVAMNADMGQTFRLLGLLPGEQLIRFNKSGPIRPLGEGVTVTMVHPTSLSCRSAGTSPWTRPTPPSPRASC